MMIEKTKLFATKSLLRSAVLLAVCLPLSIVALLKLIYFAPQNENQYLNSVLGGFKNFVTVIYQKLETVQFFWSFAPTPTIERLATLGNVMTILTVIGVFWGMASFGVGRKALNDLSAAKRGALKRELEDEYRNL